MRNLTFGALVIVVGTVAALPFRRASVDSDPDAVDQRLTTGPESDLAISNESVTYDQLYATPETTAANSASHSFGGPPASLASQYHAADRLRGIPSNAEASPRRDLRLPLTYDDLAVPLATPHYTDGRFNALANQQSAPGYSPAASPFTPQAQQMATDSRFAPMQVATEQAASGSRSPWEMASDLPQSILNASAPPQGLSPGPATTPATAPAVQAPSPGSVAGRLASDSRPSDSRPGEQVAGWPVASAPVASQPAEPERTRHWIRQPD